MNSRRRRDGGHEPGGGAPSDPSPDSIRRALGERVKELQGLYAIRSLAVDPALSLEEVLQRVTARLPAAWQYPEIAAARIRIDTSEYVSEGFRETPWCQMARLGDRGDLMVCYREERPVAAEGPFLAEERELIEAVAGELLASLRLREAQQALAESEKLLNRRLAMEHLVAGIAAAFVRAEPAGLDGVVDETLGRLGAFVGVDRTYLFLIHHDGRLMSNSHEWVAPGIAPQRQNLQSVPVEAAPWWMAQLNADRVIDLPDISDMPAEAATERAALEAQSIRSVLVVPIWNRQQLRGFLGFDRVTRAAAPDADDVRLLRLVAQTVGDGLARLEVEQNLQLSNRAIEAATNGIMIVDASDERHPLTYVNPAFERITGYTEREVLGRNPAFLNGGDTDQPGFRELRNAVAEQGSATVLLRNYRKDGSLFWNELYVAPVRDEKGCLTHYVGVVNDVTERISYQKELEYRAQHDELTGLHNRQLMRDRLEQTLIYAERHQRTAAVLFLDLDRFKLVNDSLGHPAGDELLQAAAERLRSSARKGDTVARYGGDEFVVVLADVAREEDVTRVVRHLLEVVSGPVTIRGHELQVTASVGISIYPRDGESADTLLRNADAAMHRSKELGRNRLQFYRAELNARMLEQLTLEGRLRRAIEGGELRLHYQPQVALRDGHVAGLEALVRWEHPELGLVPPGQFIPLAEESGLVVPLGEWVLRSACAQLDRWQTPGASPITVGVNLSVKQLEREEFPDRVAEILQETGVEPHRLELEVTESALMADPELMLRQLQRLRALGCKLSLDDFGTGYSSLGYLKRFPFDRLKIDKSFVADITSAPQDAAIARTIIAMARTLGLEVLAEGVETEAQLSYLKRNGCDMVQGFLISRPESAERIERALREGLDTRAVSVPGQHQPAILVIDDEPNMTRALNRLLRRDGYRVLATNDPREAFDLLAMNDVHVILSDQRMPEMTGTQLLSQVKELYPDIVRIILSGYTELKTVTEAVNQGWIYKFLTKPWEDDDLRAQIREAFARYERNRTQREE